jgi:hypothetical protein
MISKGMWFLLGLWIISSLWGCSGVTPSGSPLSAPFFLPTAEDTTRLATLTHELDMRALQCAEAFTCEQVHFARALVSLFKNKEAARASFLRVIDDNPSSHLAASSKLWLRLIGEDSTAGTPTVEQQNPLIEITAQLVRDWMERQLAEYTNSGKPGALTNTEDLMIDQLRVVQVLQKQVRERDRRIALLRSQLDALRLIDQDHEERKRPLKMPATLPPSDGASSLGCRGDTGKKDTKANRRIR